MFPFWDRASDEHVAALLAGERHQAEEHRAAVQRIVQQAHEHDDYWPNWDGPTAGPGPYGDRR